MEDDDACDDHFGTFFQMAEFKSEPMNLPNKSTIDDIESEIGDDNNSTGRAAVDEVYTRYKFDRTLPDLPICEMKDYLLDAIDDNPVIILEGATGCGKTTQVCLQKICQQNVQVISMLCNC